MPDGEDNMPDCFSKLPLFASDDEVAAAIVGTKNAQKWKKERLPTLSGKPGFPPVDPYHGGRPVPLLWKFYQSYLHIASTGETEIRQSESHLEGQWRRPRRGAKKP